MKHELVLMDYELVDQPRTRVKTFRHVEVVINVDLTQLRCSPGPRVARSSGSQWQAAVRFDKAVEDLEVLGEKAAPKLHLLRQ